GPQPRGHLDPERRAGHPLLTSWCSRSEWVMTASAAGTAHPGLRLFLGFCRRLAVGQLAVVLPDGRRHEFTGATPGPAATLLIKQPRFVRRLLTGGANGLADAYLDGDYDSPDLTALLELAAAN